MASKSESRVLDVFGPNFLIETNGAVGVAGQLKYQLYSVTDGGIKYQQALYDVYTTDWLFLLMVQAIPLEVFISIRSCNQIQKFN